MAGLPARSKILYVTINCYDLQWFSFAGQIGILHKMYGLIFGNSANNTVIINTFNVQNCNITNARMYH